MKYFRFEPAYWFQRPRTTPGRGITRRLGIYAGQVDGILGPDTRRSIEDYQVKNKLPVTGQPNQGLNALLGLF
jgi:peptidoglycan hydrolase-like protein with peptidoglycan-binding domain